MALRIDDRFPGANVRVLDLIGGQNPELVFAADPHGGPEALWFDFRVADDSPPEPAPESLRLTLRFFGNLLGGDGNPDFCRPVFRADGKNWERLASPSVAHLPDGQSVLEWRIPYPVAPVEIALSHPYLPDDLRSLLQRSKGYWHEEGIGLTQKGNVLKRLDNNASLESLRGVRPRGLYLLARQHAGEAPGSWVLDGMLDGISRRKTGSPWRVWAVPFADLDGTLAGDYGKDAFPYDLNRAWGKPPMRHETLVIQRDMRRWAALCRPELVLDLHAPSVCEHDGIYLYLRPREDASAQRADLAWINVLRQELGPEFAADNFSRTADYPSRWDTARLTDFAHDAFDCAAFSMEIPYALCGTAPMTPKQYREAGRRLARAILNRW